MSSPDDSIPPGWDYNPAAWSQRIPIVVLAMMGFFIAAYLAGYQFGLLSDVWEPFFGDGSIRVLNSPVSHVLSALAGISLITFGSSCSELYKSSIENLFKKISIPMIIHEEITRVASDIVSCGPAFFSYILQRFVGAAVKETSITIDEANQLASGMVIGLGKLLEQEIFTLPVLQEKVCVKGGVTGEGIKVLENELGEIFEHLFQSTHAKFYEDIEKIAKQFNE